jgi:hypothetical protein
MSQFTFYYLKMLHRIEIAVWLVIVDMLNSESYTAQSSDCQRITSNEVTGAGRRPDMSAHHRSHMAEQKPSIAKLSHIIADPRI